MTTLGLRSDSRTRRGASLADLTSRELEVLQLLLTGKTNKAIASEVRISEKTVEFHLDKIYTKIGARSRLMAGVWAVQQGLQVGSRVVSE